MQHKLLLTALAIALSGSVYAVKVPEGTQLAETQNIVINNGSEPQSFDPHNRRCAGICCCLSII